MKNDSCIGRLTATWSQLRSGRGKGPEIAVFRGEGVEEEKKMEGVVSVARLRFEKKPGGAGASVTPSKLNHTSFWCGRTSENRNGARNKGNAQSPTSNRRVTVCGAVGWVDGACGGWVRG